MDSENWNTVLSSLHRTTSVNDVDALGHVTDTLKCHVAFYEQPSSVRHPLFAVSKKIVAECLRLLVTWTKSLPDHIGLVVDDPAAPLELPLGTHVGKNGEQLIPIRVDMVESAKAFLDHDKVTDQTVDERALFLVEQGVLRGEIKLAGQQLGIPLRDLFPSLHTLRATAFEKSRERLVQDAVDFLKHPSVQGKSVNQRVQFLRYKLGRQLTEQIIKQEILPAAGMASEFDTFSKLDEQVQVAIDFLTSDTVKDQPLDKKIRFLENKGLTKEQIDTACQFVNVDVSAKTLAAAAGTSEGGAENANVQTAINFLANKDMAKRPLTEKVEFMRRKGLSESEIQATLHHVSEHDTPHPIGDASSGATPAAASSGSSPGVSPSDAESSTTPKSTTAPTSPTTPKSPTAPTSPTTPKTRQSHVNRAKSFFSDTAIASKPLKDKVAFLLNKGLTREEVEAGAKLVGLEKLVRKHLDAANDPLSPPSAKLDQALQFFRHPGVLDKPFAQLSAFLKDKGLSEQVIRDAYRQVQEEQEEAGVIATANGQVREDYVKKGEQFMLHPSVQNQTKGQVAQFLKRKGLSDGEIQEAAKRVARVNKPNHTGHVDASANGNASSKTDGTTFSKTSENTASKIRLNNTSAIAPRVRGLTKRDCAQEQHQGEQHATTTDQVVLRGDEIEQAAEFMRNKDILRTTVFGDRILYMKTKGLHDEEIRAALGMVLNTDTLTYSPHGNKLGSNTDTLGLVLGAVHACLKAFSNVPVSGKAHLFLPKLSSNNLDHHIPSATFQGAKPGMVFKSGPVGLGYYEDDGCLDDERPVCLANMAMEVVHLGTRYAGWMNVNPGCLVSCVQLAHAFAHSKVYRLACASNPMLYGSEEGLQLHPEACEEYIGVALDAVACAPTSEEYVRNRTLRPARSHVVADVGDKSPFASLVDNQVLVDGFPVTMALDTVVETLSDGAQVESLLGSFQDPMNADRPHEEHGFMFARGWHNRYGSLVASSDRFDGVRVSEQLCASLSTGGLSPGMVMAQCTSLAGLLCGLKEHGYMFEKRGQNLFGASRELIVGALYSLVPGPASTIDRAERVENALGLTTQNSREAHVHDMYHGEFAFLGVAIGSGLVYMNQMGGIAVTEGSEQGTLFVQLLCETLLNGSVRFRRLFDDVTGQVPEGIVPLFVESTLFRLSSQIVSMLTGLLADQGVASGITIKDWVLHRFHAHAVYVYTCCSKSRLLGSVVARRALCEREKAQEANTAPDVVQALGVEHGAIARVLQTTFLATVLVSDAVALSMDGDAAFVVWDSFAYLSAYGVFVNELFGVHEWVNFHVSTAVASGCHPGDEHAAIKSGTRRLIRLLSNQREDPVVIDKAARQGDAPFYNWMYSSRLLYLLQTAEDWVLREPLLDQINVPYQTLRNGDPSRLLVEDFVNSLLHAVQLPQGSLNKEVHFWLTSAVADVRSRADMAKWASVLDSQEMGSGDGEEEGIEGNGGEEEGIEGNGGEEEGIENNHDNEDNQGSNGVSLRLALIPSYVDVTLASHPVSTETETLAFVLGSISTSLGGDPDELALGMSAMVFSRVFASTREAVLEWNEMKRNAVGQGELQRARNGKSVYESTRMLVTLTLTMLKALSLAVLPRALELVQQLVEDVLDEEPQELMFDGKAIAALLFGVVSRTNDTPRRTVLARWYLTSIQPLFGRGRVRSKL